MKEGRESFREERFPLTDFYELSGRPGEFIFSGILKANQDQPPEGKTNEEYIFSDSGRGDGGRRRASEGGGRRGSGGDASIAGEV